MELVYHQNELFGIQMELIILLLYPYIVHLILSDLDEDKHEMMMIKIKILQER